MQKTILIVEDNDKNLKLFQVILEATGYLTLLAGNGVEAVKAATERAPDLVLMDIQMPVMDGITAFCMLQADDRTRDIPVIALTSYAMKGDRDRLMKAGFTDYISKPIEKERFLAQVRAALEASASTRGNPQQN